MNLFQAAILAVIEGLTEFLPISSTGHLILAAHLMGISQTNFVKTFEIIIQLGAIMAVAFLYLPELLKNRDIWFKLFAAFAPTAAVGFFLYPLIKSTLIGNPFITVAALAIGGVLIIILEKWVFTTTRHAHSLDRLTLPQAVIIGALQSLSVIPGVSRAAATIIGGMLAGLDRGSAVKFSFLLAMPTMVAATGLDLFESGLTFSQPEMLLLIAGTVIAFLTALASVKWFLSFVQTKTLTAFGIYRILLAVTYYYLVLR